jgi:hypothetical protein
VITFRLQLLYLWGKRFRYPLVRRLGGLQSPYSFKSRIIFRIMFLLYKAITDVQDDDDDDDDDDIIIIIIIIIIIM